MLLLGIILACSGQSKSIDSATDAAIDGNNPSNHTGGNAGIDELDAEVLFSVSERPWDLAFHPDGRLFCSAQTGGKLYAWDPASEESSEVPGFYEGLVAIDFQGESLVYTSTADTNTGALVLHDFATNTQRILSTQSDDGVLMRWPIDIAVGPANSWFVADYNAQTVFHVTETGTNTVNTGSTKPTSVLFVDNTLYTGGDDGIFELNWSTQENAQIDTRPAAALAVINGAIIAAGNPNAVFVVNGDVLGFEGPARHGAIVYNGDRLFLADRIGEGVWVATP